MYMYVYIYIYICVSAICVLLFFCSAIMMMMMMMRMMMVPFFCFRNFAVVEILKPAATQRFYIRLRLLLRSHVVASSRRSCPTAALIVVGPTPLLHRRLWPLHRRLLWLWKGDAVVIDDVTRRLWLRRRLWLHAWRCNHRALTLRIRPLPLTFDRLLNHPLLPQHIPPLQLSLILPRLPL